MRILRIKIGTLANRLEKKKVKMVFKNLVKNRQWCIRDTFIMLSRKNIFYTHAHQKIVRYYIMLSTQYIYIYILQN